MEARIKLTYKKEREAKAVAKAVSPDNIKVPQGLFIKTARRDSKVSTLIKCETKLQTFIETIDDFLCCVSIAEKTFSVAKKLRAAPRQLEF